MDLALQRAGVHSKNIRQAVTPTQKGEMLP